MPPVGQHEFAETYRKTHSPTAGRVKTLPYSKSSSNACNVRFCGGGGIHASRERGTISPERKENCPAPRREP